MKSMTGFGMAEYSDELAQISVEIKTINHRYKDFNIRISRKFAPLEELIRKHISDTVSRGRVDVGVKIKTFQSDNNSIKYDAEAAKKYMDILAQIGRDFPEIENDVKITAIARFPDVIVADEEVVDINEMWNKVKPCLDKSLTMLDQSRTEEGETLKLDFVKRCALIETACNDIEKHSADIPKLYYQQLLKNVQNYAAGVVDEQRLLTEMAVYADRCSITEELVRLKSHLANFKKIIQLKEPIGRKLDFLFQEINREANTIASKSNSFEISTIVVEIKSELEKMREQIQNIE